MAGRWSRLHRASSAAERVVADPAADAPVLEGGIALPVDGADAGERTGEDSAGGTVGKGGWVVAARIVSQAAQFLTILVAARAMGPAEFGTFALLSAVAIGLTRFSEAGWREYVMAAESSAASDQANLLAALCGAVSLGLGLLASLIMAKAQGEAAGAAVMALLALWVLLTTLSATQAGMLVKQGRLRILAAAQIAGEIAGLLAALLTFAMGGGIFGLAAAKLGMQATVLAISLGATRWFPLGHLQAEAAREAFLFSRRILLTRLIGFFQENVAIFAIGALVGPAGAGLFRAAARLGGALLDVVSEPVRLLAWSSFRGADHAQAADRLLGLTLTVATPLFVGLAVTADHAVRLALGPEWAASAPLLVAFALAGWLSTFNVVTEPLLVLTGRIELVPRLSLAFTILHLALLLSLAPFGILWIAVGQFVATALMLPVLLVVQHRYGGISLSKLFWNFLPALAGAAVLVCAVWAVRASLPLETTEWVRMAAEASAGATAYLAVTLMLVPRHVWRLKEAPASA